MLSSRSIGRALATAEKPFMLFSSFLFCIIFILVTGIADSPGLELKERVGRSFAFWGFFTFNVAIYSYIGTLLYTYY